MQRFSQRAKGAGLSFFALWMLAMAGGARAQPASCMKGLRQVPAAEDPLGYRQRGERCEGRYSFQPYAGESLRILSFISSELSFPRNGRDVVYLHGCSKVPRAEISINSTAIDPRFLYRMDALPLKSQPYVLSWPMDVVAGLRLTNQDLGIVARTSASDRGKAVQALVPLRVSRDASPAGCPSSMSLVVLSNIDLGSLRVRLYAIQPANRNAPLVLDKVFGGGPYLAYKPILLPLELPSHPGLFSLEIGGRAGETADDVSLTAEDYILYQP